LSFCGAETDLAEKLVVLLVEKFSDALLVLLNNISFVRPKRPDKLEALNG